MSRAPKPKPDDPAQSKRFRDMARELETDDRPEEFDRVFAKIAPSKAERADSKTVR